MIGRAALLLAMSFVLAPRVAAADARQVWLWFADGSDPPVRTSCLGRPAPFTCDYAPDAEGCERAIFAYLDRWYADFDVTFTFAKPATASYYTVVVTSDGAWCNAGPNDFGLSQLTADCADLQGGHALVYKCGTDVKRCATAIAQEQAHLVGLEHTISPNDVMNPDFVTTHDGFQDADNPVTGTTCQRTQNSYRLMLARLGAWPGGGKPSPFAAADGGAPDAVDGGGPGADAPAPFDATNDVSSADGDSEDASTRDAPAEGGSSAAPSRGHGGGCALGSVPVSASDLPVAGPALFALFMLRRRRPRR